MLHEIVPPAADEVGIGDRPVVAVRQDDEVKVLVGLHQRIDHLLRPRAKGEGHPRLAGFTFDHSASGVVVGRGHGERTTRMVTATDNDVTGSEMPTPCEELTAASQPVRSHGGRFDNVMELRPRRA